MSTDSLKFPRGITGTQPDTSLSLVMPHVGKEEMTSQSKYYALSRKKQSCGFGNIPCKVEKSQETAVSWLHSNTLWAKGYTIET